MDDRHLREGRPSADALLQAAQQGLRGRLKIFVGAAPGVGKTYEMLTAARARLREGIDVVVGVVETRGRKETEALLDGLEVMPRLSVEYKGRVLPEMDLDALLARLPQLALVDVLAHTNAPGSRHPKRYMDVDELISAGMLTSISHDPRTPLASIIGSATSLTANAGALDATTRLDLARNIQDEAERLNRFIGNLLDMTRIEAGPLPLRTSPVELSDVIGNALRRAGKVLAAHRTEVRLPSDLPMPDLDDVLFEQALFNLLDNARKYAPAGSLITISAWQEGGQIFLRVLDEGPGIPPADLEHIFDKFYRVGGADRRRAGTGLGLAICRGFIEAMHGTITAANRNDRPGAVFTVMLPVPANADRRTETVA